MLTIQVSSARERVRQIGIIVEKACDDQGDRRSALRSVLNLQHGLDRQVSRLSGMCVHARSRAKTRLVDRCTRLVVELQACLDELSVQRRRLLKAPHGIHFATGPGYLAHHEFHWSKLESRDKDV